MIWWPVHHLCSMPPAALGSRPLLHRMAGDHPDTGEFFFSALAAFRTRTAYANSGEDHLVAWSGSSLRTTDELPAHKKQSSSPLAVLTPGKVVEMMTSRVVHPVRSLLGWGAAAAKGGASDGPRGSYVIHEDGVGAGMWSDDPAVVSISRQGPIGRGFPFQFGLGAWGHTMRPERQLRTFAIQQHRNATTCTQIGVLGSEGSMARGSSTEESEASRDRAIRAADSLSPADESTEALR